MCASCRRCWSTTPRTVCRRRPPGHQARQGAGVLLTALRQGLCRRGASDLGQGRAGRHQSAHRRGGRRGQGTAAGHCRADHAPVPAHLRRRDRVARDQMQKFLRGSGIAPDEFENAAGAGRRTRSSPGRSARIRARLARQAQAQTDLRLGSGLVPDRRVLRRQRHQRRGHAEERELQAPPGARRRCWNGSQARRESETRNAASRALTIYTTGRGHIRSRSSRCRCSLTR